MTSEATGLTTRADAQDTFVALLTAPFVSARVAPARFAAVLQHRAQLTEWTGRLAYRLVIAGSVARMHRDPAGPQRTAAPMIGAPPSRRTLTLMALTAAACEDADMTTTVQALSDEVRAICAAPGARVLPYNPDRRTERQAFLRGVNQLAGLGILLRRTTDEALLRQWEEDGTGVGAGFEVDRDALLQFTDPHTVALALRQPEVDEDDGDDNDGLKSTPGTRTATRSQRILRTLVEDTALLYADLHPEDAEYARGQRSWLAGHACDMTGGTVEIREEGMLLRLPPDRPASVAATVAFPAATAIPWFALKMLEAVVTGRSPDNDGRIPLTPDEVETAAERVYTGNFGALTNDIKKSPLVMLAAVEPVLTEAGLVRVSVAGWTVLPVAGRYRDPRAVWEPTLEDMMHDDA
ncbi:MAG TPA: DUF2398 family protein [Streptosporangiaceae bacterium]|jgi:uncharacterized protein (TIGR02678 family)|nr:DUF2398 family protein [Streptosporangiaceae bacterium]